MDALHFHEANSHSYLNSKRGLIHSVSAAFNSQPIIVSKAGILIPFLLGKSEEHSTQEAMAYSLHNTGTSGW